MTAPNREAIEAAVQEAALWLESSGHIQSLPWSIHRGYTLVKGFAIRSERDFALINMRMEAALTAALPHLLAAKDAEIAALREAYAKVAETHSHRGVMDYDLGYIDGRKDAAAAVRAALEMSGGVR